MTNAQSPIRGLRQIKSEGVVICGRGALNILRCFKNAGVSTFVASPDEADYAFYSRQCTYKGVTASPRLAPAKFVEDLIAIGKLHLHMPVLLYGDDATLLTLSRNRKRLSPYYKFLLPDEELLEDLTDKVRFEKIAKQFGLPIPRGMRMTPGDWGKGIPHGLTFPCILKPNNHIGWSEFVAGIFPDAPWSPQKALLARNLAEFEVLARHCAQFPQDIVIQEYVRGGDENIYSFHGYSDRQSEMLGYFVGRKVRTYPKVSGESTCLELVKDAEVVRLGMEIVQKLGLVGPYKIDFKKDCGTHRFYVLEVNTRFTLWSQLGAACGVNLPWIAYANLNGQISPRTTDYRTGVRWVSFGSDMRAFVRHYRRDGDLSWLQWLQSYICPKVYDIFSWTDPAPFVVNLVAYIKGRVRKLIALKHDAI